MIHICAHSSVWGRRVDFWKRLSKVPGAVSLPMCTESHSARFWVTAHDDKLGKGRTGLESTSPALWLLPYTKSSWRQQGSETGQAHRGMCCNSTLQPPEPDRSALKRQHHKQRTGARQRPSVVNDNLKTFKDTTKTIQAQPRLPSGSSFCAETG